MNDCKFCNIENKEENTIIFENDNFYIVPSLGSIVPNYLLIVSKRHIYAMSELNESEFKEYEALLKEFSKIYEEKFNRKPLIFEHGSVSRNENSASSVVHAHSHIVGYSFKDEKKLINDLKFVKIELKELKSLKQNYIFYISNNGKCYITIDFPSISQLMRIKIAEEIGIKDKYNWKTDKFMDNIKITLENFKKK